MNWLDVVTPGAGALILTAMAISFVLRGRLGEMVMDRPNERSLHEQPVPRSGGVILVIAASLCTLTIGGYATWPAFALAAPLLVVSFIDDIQGLDVAPRLAVQLVCALAGAYFATKVPWYETLAVAVGIVWCTNLYNFMDGSDGLAGGMTVIGFGSYAVAATVSGNYPLAIASSAFACAGAGFLLFNFHPARIFMGDGGAIPLGFLAAVFGLMGQSQGTWPWWFPVLVFAPFLTDATVMLLRRLLRGERVGVAHRDHYYQRMVRSGLGHRKTALVWYAAMIVCGGTALLLRTTPFGAWSLPAGAVLALASLTYIDTRLAPLPEPKPEHVSKLGLVIRRLVVPVLDLCLAAVALYVAQINGFADLDKLADGMLPVLIWYLPAAALLFWLFGLYRAVWAFVGIPDTLRVIAASVGLFVVSLIGRAATDHLDVHWLFVSIRAMAWSVLMMGGMRLCYRLWSEASNRHFFGISGRPLLVIGAGTEAAGLARQLARNSKWNLIGFLDNDLRLKGREILGRPVFGDIGDLMRIARRFAVKDVVLAGEIGEEGGENLRQLCEREKLRLLATPTLDDLLRSRKRLDDVQLLDEGALLGREPVRLETSEVEAALSGQVVMVTGAGGSIGSELCRQIATFSPRLLLFYELSEFALYTLTEEFAAKFPHIPFEAVIGDVKDPVQLDRVMAAFKPAVIYHAAAYKHVPLMEQANAWQAARNNVLGTIRTAEAAIRNRVAQFVLISTDKAVNPTNVMGATKRLAEIACQAIQQKTTGTRFATVRFGNVLGSNGSVIPKFRKQIDAGGPVTVTHPEITRYFMSIREAAQLVLQASAMEARGAIFVLDMGEPVRIVDLAKQLISLAGFDEGEIQIAFTGLRPGEKLYEEVLADTEATITTRYSKLRIAHTRPVPGSVLTEIDAWISSTTPATAERVREKLLSWIPEYNSRPQGEVEHAANIQLRGVGFIGHP